MDLATPLQIEHALRHNLGHYRVVRAQEQAEIVRDQIGGALILAIGIRETWGKNIRGGAKFVDGRWLPEDDPTRQDVGWLQISARYHPEVLQGMPGVKVGTWTPVVAGKTAYDAGYVPRYTDALRYVIDELTASYEYGRIKGVKPEHLRRFAAAAHNAGKGGALQGYREGNVDKYTAGGDYSAWVEDARKKIRTWLTNNPKWQYNPDTV